QRAVRKVERRQSHSAGQPGARLTPLESAGDHQVEGEEQLALEAEHDPLPHPAHAPHPAAVGRFGRRLDGAQQVDSGDAGTLERLAGEAMFQRFHVDRDVRQLGHDASLPEDLAGTQPRSPAGPGLGYSPAAMKTMTEIARQLDLDPAHLEPYGNDKAKV